LVAAAVLWYSIGANFTDAKLRSADGRCFDRKNDSPNDRTQVALKSISTHQLYIALARFMRANSRVTK
jgi:pyoverdine/dityrosine biosynthesis protein Dit1